MKHWQSALQIDPTKHRSTKCARPRGAPNVIDRDAPPVGLYSQCDFPPTACVRRCQLERSQAHPVATARAGDTISCRAPATVDAGVRPCPTPPLSKRYDVGLAVGAWGVRPSLRAARAFQGVPHQDPAASQAWKGASRARQSAIETRRGRGSAGCRVSTSQPPTRGVSGPSLKPRGLARAWRAVPRHEQPTVAAAGAPYACQTQSGFSWSSAGGGSRSACSAETRAENFKIYAGRPHPLGVPRRAMPDPRRAAS